MRALAAAALIAFLWSTPATAQEEATTADPAYVILALTDFVVVPPLAVNAVFVAQHKHKVGGAVVGLVTGAVGVGMGLAIGLPTTNSTKAAFGWATAGLGVVDLGMALWVLAVPRHHHERTATSWTIGPILSSRGRLVPGATFSLLRF